jgi:hypothetical protein
MEMAGYLGFERQESPAAYSGALIPFKGNSLLADRGFVVAR